MRSWPVLAFAALVACSNDFDALEVGDAGSGGTTSIASTSASSGESGVGGPASASSGGDPSSGGSGGKAATVSDAGVAGGGGVAPEPPTCADQYGASANEMCKESATECAFNFSNGTQSCGAVCQAAGGECVGTFYDGPGNCDFDPGAPEPCSLVGWSDGVCVCSRGCGGKAACAMPAICTAGACL